MLCPSLPVQPIVAPPVDAGVAVALIHFGQALGVMEALGAEAGEAIDAILACAPIVARIAGTFIDVDVAHAPWERGEQQSVSSSRDTALRVHGLLGTRRLLQILEAQVSVCQAASGVKGVHTAALHSWLNSVQSGGEITAVRRGPRCGLLWFRRDTIEGSQFQPVTLPAEADKGWLYGRLLASRSTKSRVAPQPLLPRAGSRRGLLLSKLFAFCSS